MGFQYTPPPMLQIGGGPIKKGCRNKRADAKDHTDLLFINLYSLDQRTDNLSAGLKIGLVESLVDFLCKSFQAPEDSPQFLFPCGFFFETLKLLLKMAKTFTHTCHSRFKFLFVNKSLCIAINQSCDPSAEFAHLGIQPLRFLRLLWS